MKELKAPEYNNQPVATLGVLADYLGTSKDTLKGNYHKNPDKFIHGKHYFNISHENMEVTTSHLLEVFDYKGTKGIQVWTERGCARLSKLLRTDEAWDLWEKMEDSYFNSSKSKTPVSFSEALFLAGKLEQEKEQALLERDIAIETKAEIGNRREATSMNTASQAVKKVNKLEIELDLSKEYCTIKRMEMINHGQKFSWRLLKSTQKEMNGKESIDIYDANYGTVKAYHVAVWQEAYGITLD